MGRATPQEIVERAREILAAAARETKHVDVGQCWCGHVYFPAGTTVRYK